MRILVTGGSSFVGATFCLRAARYHDICALHHSTPLRLSGVTPLRVDLRRSRDVALLAGREPDAVVHIACKIKTRHAGDSDAAEGARKVNRRMMDAVLALARPVIYASSTVVHWKRPSAYRDSRLEDEERLAESGLPYAILRPSAPYGPRLLTHQPRHAESFHTLTDWIRRSPVVPVLGDGEYRRQPVHLHDLSDAILALLEKPLPRVAHDVGGAAPLTMNEIIALLGEAMNRPARRLHLPVTLCSRIARVHPDFEPSLIAAATEDEVADPTAITALTGVAMRGFSEGLRDLL